MGKRKKTPTLTADEVGVATELVKRCWWRKITVPKEPLAQLLEGCYESDGIDSSGNRRAGRKRLLAMLIPRAIEAAKYSTPRTKRYRLRKHVSFDGDVMEASAFVDLLSAFARVPSAAMKGAMRATGDQDDHDQDTIAGLLHSRYCVLSDHVPGVPLNRRLVEFASRLRDLLNRWSGPRSVPQAERRKFLAEARRVRKEVKREELAREVKHSPTKRVREREFERLVLEIMETVRQHTGRRKHTAIRELLDAFTGIETDVRNLYRLAKKTKSREPRQ